MIPSHVDLAGAELEIADVEGRENRLWEVCQSITEEFDFIFVDTPPSLSLLTVNVLNFALEVLAPCQTQPYAYGALKELFETVELIKEETNPDLRVSGILPTFFDGRTRISQSILQKLRENETYKDFVFDSVIRMNTTISESADVGKPVVFYRSGSNGAKDYVRAARELAER